MPFTLERTVIKIYRLRFLHFIARMLFLDEIILATGKKGLNVQAKIDADHETSLRVATRLLEATKQDISRQRYRAATRKGL